MPDLPTGQLIRLYRIDQKRSTVNLATHAGISARYLEMIEAGTKTPSLSVLRRLAKVLRVRTAALIGEAPSEDDEGPVNPRLADVERALVTYRTLALSEEADLPGLDELARQIEAGWQAWFTSPTKYSDVLPTLPGLIATAERVVHDSGHSPEACRLACEVYQLARPVLKHLGRVDMGGLVADRCMRHAEATDDPLLIAAATWNLGQALYADDKPGAALDVAIRGSEKLETVLPEGSPAHVAAYGGLQQVVAISAVQLGDPWRAREVLRGPAWNAATRVGDGRDDHHLFFGPTNVRIHMVYVEQQTGETAEALRLADDVDITQIVSPERKTSHLYQVARGYECKGNDTAVFVHLKMAEKLCPEDFRHKKVVRDMVATLVRRARPSYASEIREFASQIGLLD